MPDLRTKEMQGNYHAFQSVVASLIVDHEGEFALLHDGQIVAVFDRPADAAMEGYRRFADGLFSIQKVTDKVVDLGFLSNGSDHGIIV